MTLLIVSFIAGLLTVLAPCILPLLPVIIGGSLTDGKRDPLKAYIITGSLAISVVVFTLLLKASTLFIDIPQSAWAFISGSLLILIGVLMIFPGIWEKIALATGFEKSSNKLLAQGFQKKSRVGDVLIGAALGPVFTTCSPTFFVILATVLPASFALGVLYIFVYAFGLSVALLSIALIGQRIVDKLNVAADPRGWFKRGMGVLFLLVGLAIMTGFDKKIETFILDNGFFDVTKVEQRLLNVAETADQKAEIESKGIPYKEIVNPSGFVNSEPFELKDLVGEKVILLDIMTYSCINCQRTFPYLADWYSKYKDNDFVIVGIHTPEFAFEKDIDNVRDAMERFGLEFPVVLDNDYGTWNAYGNRYWPRKYLIDVHGNIVYDHIGEGGYQETEEKIIELLKELHATKGDDMTIEKEMSNISLPSGFQRVAGGGSPEMYFGARRNEYFTNGTRGRTGEQTLSVPEHGGLNELYLGGTWNITDESAVSSSDGAQIVLKYRASKVFMVLGAGEPVRAEIKQNGEYLSKDAAGIDVMFDGDVSYIVVDKERLYQIIDEDAPGTHTFELMVPEGELEAFTFTFG